MVIKGLSDSFDEFPYAKLLLNAVLFVSPRIKEKTHWNKISEIMCFLSAITDLLRNAVKNVLHSLSWFYFQVSLLSVRSSALFQALSLVIRRKGWSQNGCFKKTKQAKFSEKQIFLTPWYARAHLTFKGLSSFTF